MFVPSMQINPSRGQKLNFEQLVQQMLLAHGGTGNPFYCPPFLTPFFRVCQSPTMQNTWRQTAATGFYLFACKHAEKSELNRTEEEPSEAQHQGQRTRRTKAAEHALDPFRGCMAVCGSGNGNGSGRASAQGLNCT